MKPRLWQLLALASLVAVAANANTRPRYGGALRVEVAESLLSYDPNPEPGFNPGEGLRQQLAALIFDRMVVLDEQGRPLPSLAASWEHDPDLRHWQFRLRPGVLMHDGKPLPLRLVVASLAAANASWHVRAAGDDVVVVESESPLPNLLAELALTRNSIVARAADGTLIGTGAFKVSQWQGGRRALLAANDDYWNGRPFVSSIELLMGRALRDQALDFRLDRADVIQTPADQARRLAQEGNRIVTSADVDMLAISFNGNDGDNPRLHEVLSLAIDRASIQSVIFQHQGEAAGGLLPQWISGYAFLFPTTAMLDRAHQQRSALPASPSLVLAYDDADPLARAVAERVTVNARDIAITVQTVGENAGARSSNATAHIIHVRAASPFAAPALETFAAALGREDAQSISAATTPEALYTAERALVGTFRVVPLVYVPECLALSARVRDWRERRDGLWPVDNVWLEGGKP
jgi:peptide/nickel transport system substrate-binding protein